MILSVQNITKSFGEDVILSQVSFHLEDYEKLAIVGINGAGKSTLLKIIVGELPPDEGLVSLAKGKSMGYLAQHQDLETEATVYDAVLEAKAELLAMEGRIRTMEEEMQALAGPALEAHMEAYHRLLSSFDAKDGYSYKSEVTGVLKGLGFAEEDFTKRCGTLSGGQKTRVSLARLLVTRPDVLLLDEPTNHLDIASISWLETFLLNYKGAVVLVAHDRYFLDKVVTKVVELSLHKAFVYDGNYSAYAQKAAKIREDYLRAYVNQQREIQRQEAVIEKLKSFNREKSIKRAESREKLLSKVEVLEKPQEERSRMKFSLSPAIISGNDVLSVEGLAKSFGSLRLFENLSFDIKRGERVALIGQNGTGKTTILKILNGVYDADAGSMRLGTNVHIGYYDQEQQNLPMEKTLFDAIADDYPSLTHTKIRNVLAAFLFTEDDVFKLVSDLSGGERGRLSLAKLMLSEANLLILDEPTNHLDIVSKEILESALQAYEGTVLFVSHDRYFINKVATRILNLTQNRLLQYVGNYDYYLEKKEATEAAYLPQKEAQQSAQMASAGKDDWKSRKEEAARLRKKQQQIKKCEEDIALLEEEIANIDEAYLQPDIAANSAKLNELSAKRSAAQAQLDALYEAWEVLCEEN